MLWSFWPHFESFLRSRTGPPSGLKTIQTVTGLVPSSNDSVSDSMEVFYGPGLNAVEKLKRLLCQPFASSLMQPMQRLLSLRQVLLNTVLGIGYLSNNRSFKAFRLALPQQGCGTWRHQIDQSWQLVDFVTLLLYFICCTKQFKFDSFHFWLFGFKRHFVQSLVFFFNQQYINRLVCIEQRLISKCI